ncbi:ATP-binding cassette domain-containing protein [Streptomyces sp. DHE17-7]|uniref:ATP-binding cassette domain-containing protein n=1 Tax=Streptomyces sp. DHE17-7 TaxID=2759949 RepID=UPI003FA7365C
MEEVALCGCCDEVLHGLSFRAEPGQTVALVRHPSGAASSPAQLLAAPDDRRLCGARVRIGGVDVRDLSARSLRDTVGMVTQDGHLFHDTVRANLLLARPDASDTELWDALRRAACVLVFVRSFARGLDTVVGERGYRLSGGERQRMTIARLLLARQRVVILDEATAHLDNTSEGGGAPGAGVFPQGLWPRPCEA